jgi:hypothetical protein
MNCEERFYDYIDYVQGKLPLDVSLEIDKHILTCSKCKEEIEKIRSFTPTLDNFNLNEPDEIYFTNLIPIINQRIENKRINKFELSQSDMLFSVVSIIVFALIVTFTYNFSNTELSIQTFENYETALNSNNYTVLNYTTYENIEPNGEIEKAVSEVITGLFLQDSEDWFSSQNNVQYYLATFSDDEVNNIIHELNNKHIIN